MSDGFPKIKAAVMQATTILFDREASVEKAWCLILRTARRIPADRQRETHAAGHLHDGRGITARRRFIIEAEVAR
ncbi:MAG TPA: hypothetical protein VLT92_12025 [Burkholderiales bacterium]|nr:hypothetical protein [Burkholderiales bacterium]